MDLYFFTVFACFAFALGACVASFLNVCIWRLPRNESVISPPSHCPNCQALIRWYQNIPIISWLALRGRCANCHKPISPRYVLVEALGGILFLLAYLQWAMPFMLHRAPVLGLVPFGDLKVILAEALVIAGLILGSFIDLEHYYLPDRVTIGGMILGVPISYFAPELQQCQADPIAALMWSGIGLTAGFFFLWGIGALFSRLFKKEAMGFGDVKLIGAVGAFFGPVAVLFTIIVSSILGSVIGLFLIVRGRTKLGTFTAIPYGPFLAVGTLVWMYWGPAIIKVYLQLMHIPSL